MASAKCAARSLSLSFWSASAVLSQFGEFLRAGGEAFVERCLDLRREGGVLVLGDRDVAVAVGDELLGDADGHGTAGAVLAFGGAAGADVVGVPHALLVGRVVQLHPRPALTAEQGAFEVVVVVATSFGGDLAGVQERLHLLPGVDVDQRLVGAGLLGSFCSARCRRSRGCAAA